MKQDSRAETFKHTLRVGSLMGEIIARLVRRSLGHDISKTESPEVEIFDEYTWKLKDLVFGTPEYQQSLDEMKPALKHHYAVNRHHPEFFGDDGINGMNLIDLIEMLSDWKAATERTQSGDLKKSLEINKERFGISDQLLRILDNTARDMLWLRGDDA